MYILFLVVLDQIMGESIYIVIIPASPAHTSRLPGYLHGEDACNRGIFRVALIMALVGKDS